MEMPLGVLESDTRVPAAIGAVSSFLTIAFIAVASRVYTRRCILKQMGMDDWSAIVAYLFTFACGFAAVWNVRNGLGRHVYFLSVGEVKEFMKTFYASIILYNVALGAIKMTFLLQYYRVLAVQKMKKIFIGAMVFVGAWSVTQVPLMIFTCTPIAKFWDTSLPGTCLPRDPSLYANAAGNIVTDILVLVLPLPIISSLKLRPGQKYVLLGIFCLGFFTCAISVIRMRFLHLGADFTWENVESASWSIGELCCGLTCSCLPACRPLVSRFIPALSSRATKSSTHRSNDSYRKRTGNISRQRDVELGGSTKRSRRLTRIPNRYAESVDSKTEMYVIADYSISQEDCDREGDLPIQVPESSHTERKTVPVRRQQSVRDDGYGFRDDAVIETRIEARPGVPDDEVRLKPGNSIEITCDIVQVSSHKVDKRLA
ncbi:hypothetical protein LX32DRAFT_719928 [Colletotrichum zoysiae]|uniref:Rhodopsin domain-containing protein n=1 Tax=Colletotrichum zoysiae TaxID=1216348 RepID=A0AAD9HIV8_9PEZI|nr:hypothetical protein LX32DRAFT_719928 [Colletotrichum zoysiae]